MTTTREKVYATPEVCAVRREKLAKRLEAMPKEHFDIEISIKKNECGTVACIAGWAVLQAIDEGLIRLNDVAVTVGDPIFSWGPVRLAAETYLGLQHIELDVNFDVDVVLFYGRHGMKAPTAQDGADALRRVGEHLYPWPHPEDA